MSIGPFQISAHANIPFLLPEFATVAPFLENDFPGNDENQTTLPQCVFGFGIKQGNLSMSKWAVTSSPKWKWKIWSPIGLRLIVDVLEPNRKHDVLVELLARQIRASKRLWVGSVSRDSALSEKTERPPAYEPFIS